MESMNLEQIDTAIWNVREKYRIFLNGLHLHLNESGKESAREIKNDIEDIHEAIRKIDKAISETATNIRDELWKVRKKSS